MELAALVVAGLAGIISALALYVADKARRDAKGARTETRRARLADVLRPELVRIRDACEILAADPGSAWRHRKTDVANSRKSVEAVKARAADSDPELATLVEELMGHLQRMFELGPGAQEFERCALDAELAAKHALNRLAP